MAQKDALKHIIPDTPRKQLRKFGKSIEKRRRAKNLSPSNFRVLLRNIVALKPSEAKPLAGLSVPRYYKLSHIDESDLVHNTLQLFFSNTTEEEKR